MSDFDAWFAQFKDDDWEDVDLRAAFDAGVASTQRALEAAREALQDVADLADRLIASKDFCLDTKAERLDAIAEKACAALSLLTPGPEEGEK